MDFINILKKFETKLEKIAYKVNITNNGYIDKEDLLQEMRLHLWRMWIKNELHQKTDSYILQSCWFHIRNYLRINSDSRKFVSIDSHVNDTEKTVANIIPEISENVPEKCHYSVIVSQIAQNGLTEREKKVFIFLMKGYTLREIGKLLGISFVRVAKIRDNIRRKYSHKIL